MPLKDPESSGASRKRKRLQEQRTITVQQSRPPQASTSTTSTAKHVSASDLPPVLEVDKFTEARLFEINALQSAMRNSKTAGAQRAFQSLPRALRRRAASHDIRRLPQRLRARARAEMPDGSVVKPKKSRANSKRKTRNTGWPSKNLLFRQRPGKGGKIWLETHIWHAKRMRMQEIWGHRLAMTPTEKAFRSSYRASFHGALVHDASYFQYLRLHGRHNRLCTVLQIVCAVSLGGADPTSPIYSSGSRACPVTLYCSDSIERCRVLGPATIIWQPIDTPDARLNARGLPREISRADTIDRTLLIRVHPSICAQVASFLTMSNSSVPSGHLKHIEVTKLTSTFLTFEVTGQRATEIIKGVLKPTKETDPTTLKSWKSLDSKAGPGSVPRNMMFGFDVYDPRLSFPPSLDRSSPGVVDSDSLIPLPEIASLPLLWKKLKDGSQKGPKYKKAQLDARRAKLLVPGTRLDPSADDDRVPILIHQYTIGPDLPPDVTRATTSNIHGWVLQVPAGWGMAFWLSLTYSQARVCGIRERGRLPFEAGTCRFPEDYPATIAYEEYEVRRMADDMLYWNRRPPAKRPNYEKLGTPSPFKVDLNSIACEMSRRKVITLAPRTSMVLPSKLVHRLINETSWEESTEGVNWRKSEYDFWKLTWQHGKGEVGDNPSASAVFSWTSLAAAFARVKVKPVGRGSPEELACIYELKKDELEKLTCKLREHGKKSGFDVDVVAELGTRPLPKSIVGRVTTGDYSLKQGRGYAVGVVALEPFLTMGEWTKEMMNAEQWCPPLVLVRNRDQEVFRLATLELIF